MEYELNRGAGTARGLDQSGAQNRDAAVVPGNDGKFRMTGKLKKAYINCGWTWLSGRILVFVG